MGRGTNAVGATKDHRHREASAGEDTREREEVIPTDRQKTETPK